MSIMPMFCYATGTVLFRVWSSHSTTVYECYTLRHIYAYFLDSKVSAYTLKIAISNSAAALFGKMFHCKQSLTQIQGYSKNQNGEERHCCGFERSMVVRSSRADLSISNANVLLLSYSPQTINVPLVHWADVTNIQRFGPHTSNPGVVGVSYFRRLVKASSCLSIFKGEQPPLKAPSTHCHLSLQSMTPW